MEINIDPVNSRRQREKGVIVYPVYSRRSAGLSIGINLYPDKKNCRFDCPYCEVFPFSSNAVFSLEQMQNDLRSCITASIQRNVPIMDICFSGNGEPTINPVFPDAFKIAEEIRKEMAPSAQHVIITNGTGLMQKEIFTLLCNAAANPSVDIWLKLDAGTSGWYRQMNRCEIPFEKLTAVKKEFAACAPFTIQTMLCLIDGKPPPQEEIQTWQDLVCELALSGNIRKVQIYGKARSAPEDPLAATLPDYCLEERAASLRKAFTEKCIATPVEVYL